MKSKIKICVIGTRGFPDIQGGVEKHCESLYPVIAGMGCFVKVFRRLPYINSENRCKQYVNLRFCDLWTIKNKYLETILHSFFAAIICIYEKPDIVHIHNIGPGLIIPLLKPFNIGVVVTYHSANYLHKKWNKLARLAFRTGEKFVDSQSDGIIFVSETQRKISSGKNKIYIPNGVKIHLCTDKSDFLTETGLLKGRYVLAVGRIVPEKGIDLLIKAFQMIKTDCKLVIAGAADCETEYSRNIKKMMDENENIIGTGYITGEPLKQLYSHARLFVLPSYNEGLSIALLEAMSYGLSVLVSDIPANRELGLLDKRFFECGNIDDLKEKMQEFLRKGISDNEKKNYKSYVTAKYNWNKIAQQTIDVYEKVMKKR